MNVNINDAKCYKPARKKLYDISLCVQPNPVIFYNKFEQANVPNIIPVFKKTAFIRPDLFAQMKEKAPTQAQAVQQGVQTGNLYMTSKEKCCILAGTRGEMWIIKPDKLAKTYEFVSGDNGTEPITPQSLNKRLRKDHTMPWTRIRTKPDSSEVFACFVPVSMTGTIQTSWGATLTVNDPAIPHGKGDFVMASKNADGTPNLQDRWVVNGLIFKDTYNNRGWTDCLVEESDGAQVTIDKLPRIVPDKVQSSSNGALPPLDKAGVVSLTQALKGVASKCDAFYGKLDNFCKNVYTNYAISPDLFFHYVDEPYARTHNFYQTVLAFVSTGEKDANGEYIQFDIKKDLEAICSKRKAKFSCLFGSYQNAVKALVGVDIKSEEFKALAAKDESYKYAINNLMEVMEDLQHYVLVCKTAFTEVAMLLSRNTADEKKISAKILKSFTNYAHQFGTSKDVFEYNIRLFDDVTYGNVDMPEGFSHRCAYYVETGLYMRSDSTKQTLSGTNTCCDVCYALVTDKSAKMPSAFAETGAYVFVGNETGMDNGYLSSGNVKGLKKISLDELIDFSFPSESQVASLNRPLTAQDFGKGVSSLIGYYKQGVHVYTNAVSGNGILSQELLNNFDVLDLVFAECVHTLSALNGDTDRDASVITMFEKAKNAKARNDLSGLFAHNADVARVMSAVSGCDEDEAFSTLAEIRRLYVKSFGEVKETLGDKLPMSDTTAMACTSVLLRARVTLGMINMLLGKYGEKAYKYATSSLLAFNCATVMNPISRGSYASAVVSGVGNNSPMAGYFPNRAERFDGNRYVKYTAVDNNGQVSIKCVNYCAKKDSKEETIGNAMQVFVEKSEEYKKFDKFLFGYLKESYADIPNLFKSTFILNLSQLFACTGFYCEPISNTKEGQEQLNEMRKNMSGSYNEKLVTECYMEVLQYAVGLRLSQVNLDGDRDALTAITSMNYLSARTEDGKQLLQSKVDSGLTVFFKVNAEDCSLTVTARHNKQALKYNVSITPDTIHSDTIFEAISEIYSKICNELGYPPFNFLLKRNFYTSVHKHNNEAVKAGDFDKMFDARGTVDYNESWSHKCMFYFPAFDGSYKMTPEGFVSLKDSEVRNVNEEDRDWYFHRLFAIKKDSFKDLGNNSVQFTLRCIMLHSKAKQSKHQCKDVDVTISLRNTGKTSSNDYMHSLADIPNLEVAWTDLNGNPCKDTIDLSSILRSGWRIEDIVTYYVWILRDIYHHDGVLRADYVNNV